MSRRRPLIFTVRKTGLPSGALFAHCATFILNSRFESAAEDARTRIENLKLNSKLNLAHSFISQIPALISGAHFKGVFQEMVQTVAFSPSIQETPPTPVRPRHRISQWDRDRNRQIEFDEIGRRMMTLR